MVLWIGGGLLYVILALTLGLVSLRKGHWVMFIIGFFMPLFWLIGAMLGPTDVASKPGPVGGSA
jgi:hypothetical protein